VRHGVGYTSYEHCANGLEQHVRLYCSPEDPVKFVQVRLRNQLDHTRRLTVTFYVEWVLGVDRSFTASHILSAYGLDGSHALFATNPYNTEFGKCCAFVACDKLVHGFTTDRTEFLGRNGDYTQPVALRRVGLNGRVQPGLDPCAVLQVHVDLPPDTEEEFLFLLGQGEDTAQAHELIRTHCNAGAAAVAWSATAANWAEILGTVQVETPEPSMDLLLNQWLLYQTVACRLWGRSALYQSSGAYGFRDQLQDVMALFHARPDLARAQLLAAARHQFEAGDVLHWWHPPSGRGVRTRISDDLLWLPYVTAQYVATTGDLSVLEEKVPFLLGEPLGDHDDERYAEYAVDSQHYTLYEHCRRALVKGTTQGQHGLPLMGGGDWNDGMNRVGIKGKGESIWLGWFLYATQMAFAEVADATAQLDDALWLRSHAVALQAALEANGWDGEWYRRAYYDDGTPLGSAQNAECRIDSIAQSWGVLSGAADPRRAQQAMNAVRENLVRRDDRLILLFTPPFNQTRRDPGYIKGYLPGVRENGGQYTHAALWSIWAWAKAGDGDLAHNLFQMINPICRADAPNKAQLYQVEPYVISADVYGVPPHVGRGGWSWYTGSSGWMYRLGIEALLGLKRDAEHVWLEPCIPNHWPGFRLLFRFGSTHYHFTVENLQGAQQGVIAVTLDGVAVPELRIPLVDDGIKHEVIVTLGR
jgi:cyclic beta-1,2-glucan synthetase